MEALLETADSSASPKLRGQALLGIGTLAQGLGEYPLSEPFLEEALTLFQCLNDQEGTVLTLMKLSVAAGGLGRIDREMVLAEQSLLIARALDGFWGTGLALSAVGQITYKYPPNFPRACAYYEESLDIAQRLGDGRQIAAASIDLAEVERARLDFKRSIVPG